MNDTMTMVQHQDQTVLGPFSRERRIYDEHRVRLLRLSPRHLIEMLQSPPGYVIQLTESLPGDAFVLAMHIDPERNCLVLTVGSLSYDPVPDGRIPPDVYLVFSLVQP